MVKEKLEIEGLDGYTVNFESCWSDQDAVEQVEDFVSGLAAAIFEELKSQKCPKVFQLHLCWHAAIDDCILWSVALEYQDTNKEDRLALQTQTATAKYWASRLGYRSEDYGAYFSVEAATPCIIESTEKCLSFCFNSTPNAIMEIVFNNYCQKANNYSLDWTVNCIEMPYPTGTGFIIPIKNPREFKPQTAEF